MASFKKFFAGNPPFTFLASRLAEDDEFVKDARRLLELSRDHHQRLCAEIAKSDVFLSRSALESIAREVIGDEKESKKLARSIYKLSAILHGADMPATQAMETLSKAIEEESESFSEDEKKIVSERIRTLAAEPASLARQFKAKELLGATGAELDDFRLICDVRPVFDEPPRKRVEGAVPITVLRLEYTKPDGDTDVFEVMVTERQIKALEEKFADARQKLRLVAELLTTHKIPVPSIGGINADASS